MDGVTLSAGTVALVLVLMAALVLAMAVLSGAIVYLYRQVLRERDALLDERNGRLIDLWREMEQKEARIEGLEVRCAQLEELVARATEGWRRAIEGRSEVPLGDR